MTEIQPFIKVVTSTEHSSKRDIVDKTIRKLVDLVDDASDFIIKYEGEGKQCIPFYTLQSRTASYTNQANSIARENS